MKLFEYKQINKVDYINQVELDQMGKDGWELILCDVGSYIFKRELVQYPKAIAPYQDIANQFKDNPQIDIDPVSGNITINP